MGTQNFAYGLHAYPALPFMDLGAGLSTLYGTLIPPSTRVAGYVLSQSSSFWSGTPEAIRAMSHPTLAGALRACRANLGDTILVLPGHTEDVTDATMLDNLVAGTKIIGVGGPFGTDAPRFTWTATAGKWTVDQANVVISGLYLDMTGIDAVVAGIDVTAANARIMNNVFMCETASAQGVSIVKLSAGSDGAVIAGNEFRGEAGDDVTIAVDIAGVSNDARICGNVMVGGWHASNGAINIAAAAKRVLVEGNTIANLFAAVTTAIRVADVASTGVLARNLMTVENNGTAANQGIVFAGTTNTKIKCLQNFTSDEAGKSGVLSPAAVAT